MYDINLDTVCWYDTAIINATVLLYEYRLFFSVVATALVAIYLPLTWGWWNHTSAYNINIKVFLVPSIHVKWCLVVMSQNLFLCAFWK